MTTSDRSSYRFLIFWHGLAVILLLVIPVFKYRVAPWALIDTELIPIVSLAAGYLASVLITLILARRGIRVGVIGSAIAVMSVYGVVFLGMLVGDQGFSRIALVAIVGCSFILAAFAHIPPRFRTWGISLLGLTVIAAISLAYSVVGPQQPPPRAVSDPTAEYFETTFYGLKSRSFPNLIPIPSASAGAITRIGDRTLLATGDGEFYLFWWSDESEPPNIEKLPYRVSLNLEAFRRDIDDEKLARRLRLVGLLVQELDDRLRVFVSHLYWHDERKCSVMRISVLKTEHEAFVSGNSSAEWTTLFESQLCLPLKKRFTRFSQQHGGRLLLFDDSTLLLTVGDHDFNGWNSDRPLAQEESNFYGKTILVPIDGIGTPEIFTLGHRNPQGLYRARDGTIWLTEHGPKGGDELNRIVRGNNYGWPISTYGSDYDSYTWPLNPKQGEQDGFAEPFYSWVPSIGISNLIGIEKNLFPNWHGDLLVASMAQRTLWRVRIRQDRVVFVEPIVVNHRIRDLVEGPGGEIILWTDDATLVVLTPADPDSLNPMMIFAANCGRCHPAQGPGHGAGPSLFGILGASVGVAPGYPYSTAMSNVGGAWTPERLDQFMKNPQSTVPGTIMNYEGLADESSRAAILEYLTSLE